MHGAGSVGNAAALRTRPLKLSLISKNTYKLHVLGVYMFILVQNSLIITVGGKRGAFMCA